MFLFAFPPFFAFLFPNCIKPPPPPLLSLQWPSENGLFCCLICFVGGSRINYGETLRGEENSPRFYFCISEKDLCEEKNAVRIIR